MLRLIPVGIIIFWLVMTGLFIQREIIPSLPQLTQPSYKALLKSHAYLESSRMGIYFAGKRIGTSTTTVSQLAEKDFRITNNAAMQLPLGGLEPRIAISAYSIIKNYLLDSFRMEVRTEMFKYEISGTVIRPDGPVGQIGNKPPYGGAHLMEIIISDGKTTSKKYMDISDNVTLSDGLAPFIAMPNLSVGKEWTINLINPLKLKVESVKARVENFTTIEWQGKEYPVYEVVINIPDQKIGVPPRAYITPEGRILKQEMLLPGTYLLREE